MIDFDLFPGKSLSDLFKDIYNNQVNKKRYITDLITDLRKMIKTPGDMTVIGPLVKDLIKASVDNDDMLIKMATIGQRLYSINSKGGGTDEMVLSDEERKQLLEQLEAVQKEVDKMPDPGETLKGVKKKLSK